MNVLENTKSLLKIRGKSQIDLCKFLGISKQAFTDWNRGKSKSYMNYVAKIAQFLEVPIDVLYGEKANSFFHTRPVGKQTRLPVYGNVSAGKGCYTDTDVVAWEVADEKYDSDEYFYLLVHGDSMSPDIKDGDYALVHSQDYIESGQIGVCVVDDEGFIKKIEYGEDTLTLVSINPYYPPRKFEKYDMNNVHIIGRVIETKRKY